MEEKYGSLSKAMLAAHNKTRSMVSKQPPRPLFSSLKDGMQQMVDAIVARLDPSALRVRTRVRAVYPQGDHWRLAIDMGGNERFDAVIVATPANVGGALLEGVDRDLADDLLGVTYSSSVTVTLGYHIEQLKGLPSGFGFLVPRSEGRRMLACTFVHNKFPHRAPADKGILRCFLGGVRDEAVLNLTDNEIVDRVRNELHEIVKLEARPMFDRIYRWRGAMAQYELGHLARIARIEKRLKDIPGLEVAGNAYHGIGVPDCIREGMNAANRVVQTLRAPAAQQTR
jgi:oxygen-dependent protoporphyrinogen oxidase